MWLVHLAPDTFIPLSVRRRCTGTPYLAFFARTVHPSRARPVLTIHIYGPLLPLHLL